MNLSTILNGSEMQLQYESKHESKHMPRRLALKVYKTEMHQWLGENQTRKVVVQ